MENLVKLNLAGWKVEWGRSHLVTLYTTLIICLGVVIIGVAAAQLPGDWVGLALFAFMAAIAELTSVELFISSRSRVSVSTIIAIAAILMFGPLAGAITQLAAGFMTTVTTTYLQHIKQERRASWFQRAAFNTGMLVISSASAGLVFIQAGGEIGKLALVTQIVPLVLAVMTDVIINLFILIGVITLQTGQKPLDIWKRDFQWGVWLGLFGGVVGGGVLALAYEIYGKLGLAVFFLPVLSIGYSFRLYLGKTKIYVNKLEEMNSMLDNSNLGLLEALGAVIDAYDVYTYGHSAQVAVYAGAIAEQMRLPKEEQSLVVRAALVHDIGKVSIMDNIIGKQGVLSDEEKNMMKRHPIIGADIIRRMEGLQALVPLVRHHHEKWDGRGYPAGLAGEEIPRGARVIAIADALDAMCSDRPYRAALGLKEIKAEFIRCSGSHFDPAVVKAMLAIFDEKGEEFIKNSAIAVDQTVSVNEIGNISQGVRYMKKSMVSEGFSHPS